MNMYWPDSPERPAIMSTNVGYASAREHAIALKKANPTISEAAAAARIGVGKSTVGAWWLKAGLRSRISMAA